MPFRFYITSLLIAGLVMFAALVPGASAARQPSVRDARKQAYKLTVAECNDRQLEFKGSILVKCWKPVERPDCQAVPTHPTVLCAMRFYLRNTSPGAERRWQACGSYGFWERVGRKTVLAPPYDEWECFATDDPPPGYQDPGHIYDLKHGHRV